MCSRSRTRSQCRLGFRLPELLERLTLLSCQTHDLGAGILALTHDLVISFYVHLSRSGGIESYPPDSRSGEGTDCVLLDNRCVNGLVSEDLWLHLCRTLPLCRSFPSFHQGFHTMTLPSIPLHQSCHFDLLLAVFRPLVLSTTRMTHGTADYIASLCSSIKAHDISTYHIAFSSP